MDILACPYDKTFPLILIVLGEREYPERKYEWDKRPFCEEYCEYRKVRIREYAKPEELPCDECIKKEVVEGILYCPTCGRWYPIKDEIPIMLPDELRNIEEDRAFLERIKDVLKARAPELADEILRKGLPVNLSTSK